MSQEDFPTLEQLEGERRILERLRGWLEEELRRVQDIQSRLLDIEAWETVQAPRPLDPEDPAIKWAIRRLESVKETHPELRFQLVSNPEGKLIGVRFNAKSPEDPSP